MMGHPALEGSAPGADHHLMRKGVTVIGKRTLFGAASLVAVAVAVLLVVGTGLSAPAVGVAYLLGLVVLAFALYVGTWALNARAWRRGRPVAGRTPEAEPYRAAGVGLELGS
jgi:hypothetical protein